MECNILISFRKTDGSLVCLLVVIKIEIKLMDEILHQVKETFLEKKSLRLTNAQDFRQFGNKNIAFY